MIRSTGQIISTKFDNFCIVHWELLWSLGIRHPACTKISVCDWNFWTTCGLVRKCSLCSPIAFTCYLFNEQWKYSTSLILIVIVMAARHACTCQYWLGIFSSINYCNSKILLRIQLGHENAQTLCCSHGLSTCIDQGSARSWIMRIKL